MESTVFASTRSWQRITKTVPDKIFATVLIILLSPLLLLIATAVKLQGDGPVIFQQARYGLNNTVFYIFKFRSMRSSDIDDSGARQTRRRDPRATRIGRFLRRSSLDELPQLFNVLQGTMSLIGPRPHPIPLDQQYENLIDSYRTRYQVKPGITGWAQVNGHRGAVADLAEMRERVEHDIYYIENWSVMLDLKILLKTLRAGFFHENAF